MFKKPLASAVSAALVLAASGPLAPNAAAQVAGRAPALETSARPALGLGTIAPLSSASLINGRLPALGASALPAAPSIAAPAPLAAVPAAAPLAASPAAAVPAASIVPGKTPDSPLAVIVSRDDRIGVAEKGAASNAFFDNAFAAPRPALDVLGRAAASDGPDRLNRPAAPSAKSPAPVQAANEETRKATGKIPGRIWVGAAAGLAIEVAVAAALGWPAALPLLAAMGRAGMAAGFLGYVSPNAKVARILGVLAGGYLGASIGGALPVLLGLVSGLVVGGFFADSRKPGAGILDLIAAPLAGMIVGVTLPAWLGGLAAKKLGAR